MMRSKNRFKRVQNKFSDEYDINGFSRASIKITGCPKFVGINYEGRKCILRCTILQIKTKQQSISSVENTGQFTTIRAQIFVYIFKYNEAILSKFKKKFIDVSNRKIDDLFDSTEKKISQISQKLEKFYFVWQYLQMETYIFPYRYSIFNDCMDMVSFSRYLKL